jgi:formamidopyrimidine-DNA glycosylase
MPELPEVETVVRELRPQLVGRRIAGLRVSRKALRRKWSRRWNGAIVGRRVRTVERRGKWILVDLDGPWLLAHLGMTGQFVVMPAADAPQNHTHLIFALDDGRHELRFRDVRRFGCATLFAARAELDAFLVGCKLGPEPFDIASADWRAALATTRRSLKALLLDQRLVAGVGNIYADESCFEAKLHPALRGDELTPRQSERLRKAMIAVLTRAIAARGSSIRDYVGGNGAPGEYQDEFRVYGRTGAPCRRCRTPIERIVLAGRSTHFCPKCQRRSAG